MPMTISTTRTSRMRLLLLMTSSWWKLTVCAALKKRVTRRNGFGADEGPFRMPLFFTKTEAIPYATGLWSRCRNIAQEEDYTGPVTAHHCSLLFRREFTVEKRPTCPLFLQPRFHDRLDELPRSNRNVAAFGHLHHGKTAFMDMLVMQTHNIQEKLIKGRAATERATEITPTLILERGVSIKDPTL